MIPLSIKQFLCSTGVAAFLCASNAVFAAGGPPIGFTAGIAAAVPGSVGEIFYEARFTVNYVSGRVTLSANQDGTGPVAVDDVLIVSVIGSDSIERTYVKDYSTNCGAITPTNPVNLQAFFRPGANDVRIVMKDKCGTLRGATSLWLLP